MLVLSYCKIGIWGLNYNLLLAWETCLLFSDEVRAKGFISYVHAANYLQFGTDGNVRMSISDIGNVGIGVFAGNHKLEVCGTIRCNELIVESFGCDFVFDETYNLRSIADLEKYVKENKHLPDIPPASVIETEGMNVGDLQARLLWKVEELSLYIIELKNDYEELRAQLENK